MLFSTQWRKRARFMYDLLDENCGKSSEEKEYARNDGKIKKELLKTSLGVVCRDTVAATQSPAQSGPGLLEQDGDDEEE